MESVGNAKYRYFEMLRICNAGLVVLVLLANLSAWRAFADDNNLRDWHPSDPFSTKVIVGQFIRLTEKGVLIKTKEGSEIDIALGASCFSAA